MLSYMLIGLFVVGFAEQSGLLKIESEPDSFYLCILAVLVWPYFAGMLVYRIFHS